MKLSKIVSASLIGLCTINSALFAKTEKKDLGDIVITGEMIDRNWLDTTTSIDVQNSRELERSNDKTIQDTFRRTSNIISTGSGVQKFDFTIRGVNTAGVGGAGNEGLASIIIDGVRSTRVQNARGINSVFDVEQVEILKGPQSTNIGKASLAGAVIIKTKDPEFEQKTHARASYGNYNTYQLAVANTGLINDELAYRVMVDHNSTDGFIENTVLNQDDFNSDTKTTARVKLLYAPNDMPFDIKIGHTRTKGKTGNLIGSYLSAGKKFVNLNPYDPEMKIEQDSTALNFNYYINDAWTIESLTTYNKFYSNDWNNQFGTTLATQSQAWNATQDQKEFTQEIRANFELDSLKGVLGLYYSNFSDKSGRSGVALLDMMGPGVHLALDQFDGEDKFKTKAIFAELDYNITPDLTLTAGGRYEKIDADSTLGGTFLLDPIGTVLASPSIASDNSGSVFLPKLGLSYAIDKTQKIGLTYTEGYRPGGLSMNLFPVLLGGSPALSKFDDEKAKNYELSYKLSLPDDSLELSANIFYLDWQDMQTTTSQSLGAPTVNVGESTVKGIEFETSWNPNEQIDTFFNIAYTKTKFDNFMQSGINRAGNEFIMSPKITASTGAYYTMNKFTYGVEASYQGSYHDSVDNVFKADALTIVNTSLNYEVKKDLNVKLFANNIFDEVIQLRDAYQAEGEEIVNYNAPRTFGFMIDYKF